eukprot:scaffold287272_cov24-Tisochrysis_lutea.AAC.1
MHRWPGRVPIGGLTGARVAMTVRPAWRTHLGRLARVIRLLHPVLERARAQVAHSGAVGFDLLQCPAAARGGRVHREDAWVPLA